MGNTQQNPAITHILETDARIAALETQVQDLLRVVDKLTKESDPKEYNIKDAAALKGCSITTFKKRYGHLIIKKPSSNPVVKGCDLV
jgi:hypothetical protein